jgi:hypothetical protein
MITYSNDPVPTILTTVIPTDSGFSWFPLVPPGKCRNSTILLIKPPPLVYPAEFIIHQSSRPSYWQYCYINHSRYGTVCRPVEQPSCCYSCLYRSDVSFCKRAAFWSLVSFVISCYYTVQRVLNLCGVHRVYQCTKRAYVLQKVLSERKLPWKPLLRSSGLGSH